MSLSIIVAIADNNAIGMNNNLLWHIPEDMKWFRETTTGHRVVMGRNTYLSLPRRPLKNRTNMVISDQPGEQFEGCIMAYSLEEARELCPSDEESFIIGGASIYRQFLPLADKLYVTKVFRAFEADAFFPEINPEEWREVKREVHGPDEHNDFSFAFIIYIRKRTDYVIP